MTALWQQLTDKFNALMLRERLTVLAGLVIVIAALFEFFIIEPQLQYRHRLMQQIGDARTNIQAAENALKAQSTQADPESVKRAYLEALRKQVAEIDQKMQRMQKGLVPPDQMAKLLEGMLARNRGLQLVSLHKLPVQRLETKTQATAAKAEASKPQELKPGAASAPDRHIYQHSFELTVEGSYADLYDYLVRLEKLPWRMFWGKITLDAEQSPKLKLTITVHTLSFSKAWLIV